MLQTDLKVIAVGKPNRGLPTAKEVFFEKKIKRQSRTEQGEK